MQNKSDDSFSLVPNVTIKKRGVSEEDLKAAIEVCECDIQEVAELLRISVRHTYRLINQFDLKDFFYTAKDEVATENSISDLAKDVTIEALLDMKETLRERREAREQKKEKLPPGLNKQEVVLLIFLDKCKAGFIELKEIKKEDNPDELSQLTDQELEQAITELDNE